MYDTPEQVARGLSGPEERFLRRMISEDVGVGGDNAGDIADIIDGILPRHRQACEEAVSRLIEKGVVESFDSQWIAFTPPGFKVGVHVSRNTRQRVKEEVPLPFELDNPTERSWRAQPRFLSDLKRIKKDGRLQEALQSAMEKVLPNPTRFDKKRPHGRYGGLYGCNVLKNYRLFWDVDGETVLFEALRPKDDPHYAE